MQRFIGRIAMTALVLATLACGELATLPTDPGNGEEPPDSTATLTRVQAQIFTPTCAASGCHDRFGSAEGLSLVAGQSYQNTVNQPASEVPSSLRVRPSDPDQSYLYRKVVGAPGIVGDRMPQGGPFLSQAQETLIRDWIRRGAPND